MIAVILIEPLHPGNIGSVARVIKNFGMDSLYLVNPQCNYLDKEAVKLSMHGNDILKQAKIISLKDLDTFDTLVATSSKLGTDYNIPRSPLRPDTLAQFLSSKQTSVGLVFGREDSGLTNEEIKRCDFIVTIPTHKNYSALNLSHSVAIILYEIFKNSSETVDKHIIAISAAEKKQILSMIDTILSKMDFSTDDKVNTQRIVWQRIVGKSFMTKREAYALMGFLRKISNHQ